MAKPLYRSVQNRWIAGVCGGISEYTGVPAILIRLLWIALCIFPVPVLIGGLLYALGWLVIPEGENRKPIRDPNTIDAEYEIRE